MKTKIQPRADAATGGDTLYFNASQNSGVSIDLGQGYDTVFVSANAPVTQVRLTFTSAEVGNFSANDAGTGTNQDGGLAVRVQTEDTDGTLQGATSRFDDEGVRFVADGDITFDVRDLTSGTERGDLFKIVSLGTAGADKLSERASTAAVYINAGGGDDTLVGGRAADFLVGNVGNDNLNGFLGDDTFIGGLGNDRITGGNGSDTAIYNISNDGNDRMNLGLGDDTVNISGGTDVAQVRLTFTSSEVGNGDANDSGAAEGQDGLLAVRIQAEDADGNLTGAFTRSDDEGISFVTDGTLTFDVRDLVSGAQRGDLFQAVRLGTGDVDVWDQSASALAQYINGGAGNDNITGGTADDFLVGGSGADRLDGSLGNDSFIGGVGDDFITGGTENDTAIVNVITDGADQVNLGVGDDNVIVSGDATAEAGTQVRVTFTSAEVGNGDVNDGVNGAGQDGGLAVRLQAEDVDGALTGSIGRYDDEGITFTAAAGVTFDVRDLTSGAQRGNDFTTVSLGTDGADTIDLSNVTGPAYANGGLLSDSITGGSGNDFLVGGGGVDFLDGGAGNDKLLGGMGSDVFRFTGDAGDDTILDFRSGKDTIDLSSYGITADDVSIRTVNGTTFLFVDDGTAGGPDFTVGFTNSNVVIGDLVF